MIDATFLEGFKGKGGVEGGGVAVPVMDPIESLEFLLVGIIISSHMQPVRLNSTIHLQKFVILFCDEKRAGQVGSITMFTSKN